MTDKMSEEKAAAVLTANLKGAKKKPSNLLQVAEACRILSRSWGWEKMTAFFVISEYQLRQIDKINDLVPEVRKMVGEGKLGIEASYQLSRLGSDAQLDAAQQAQKLRAHEVRQLVHLLLNDSELSANKAKEMTMKSSRKEINMLVLPLTSNTYTELQQLSKESKLNIHDFALKIIEEYIHATNG